MNGDAEPPLRNDCCSGDGREVCECESDFLRDAEGSKAAAGDEERLDPV